MASCVAMSGDAQHSQLRAASQREELECLASELSQLRAALGCFDESQRSTGAAWPIVPKALAACGAEVMQLRAGSEELKAELARVRGTTASMQAQRQRQQLEAASEVRALQTRIQEEQRMRREAAHSWTVVESRLAADAAALEGEARARLWEAEALLEAEARGVSLELAEERQHRRHFHAAGVARHRSRCAEMEAELQSAECEEQTLEASQLRLEEEAERLSAQASVAELQAQTLSSELGRATSASEELAAALRRNLESSAAAGLAEEVLEAEENVAVSEAALEAWRRRSSGEAADAGCAAEACVQALRARLTSAARSELSCFAIRCREEELAAQHSSAQRAEVAETEAELRLAALRHHGKEALSAARLRSSEDCAARKQSLFVLAAAVRDLEGMVPLVEKDTCSHLRYGACMFAALGVTESMAY
ncbi:unnamed protein product [Polarella glacialis]|uniref:Uncharacterized protein n=1 Tax=Polarella glacialis TaxID=89957 RepID=A0A813LU73_POLGL|nr:unnamed protein product [Polarella glacialis]